MGQSGLLVIGQLILIKQPKLTILVFDEKHNNRLTILDNNIETIHDHLSSGKGFSGHGHDAGNIVSNHFIP